jgi:ribosomal protein L7Ae-like RNA K-turn-binding protein
MSRRLGAPDALLRMLGLAARAGAVLPGTERVREAARAGALEFVLVAADASDNSRDKLLPLLAARQLPHAVRYTRAELGRAVGKAPVSAIGVTDRKFAARVKELINGG